MTTILPGTIPLGSVPLVDALWVLAFVTPVAVALGFAHVPSARESLSSWAWTGVLPAGALVLLGDERLRQVEWMLLGTSVELDRVGRPLLGMAVLLYGLALAFVPRSGTERAPGLSALLLVCFAANAGVFVAADVVTFYLFFTVMSFVGYALVVHDRSASSRRAGRIYLVLAVVGEGAVLAAMLLVTHAGASRLADVPAAVAASPYASLVVALLLVGFGVKAGTVPLHVWLPLAHPAAPTPASAVLSGVMVKAGLVGWLRFLPLGETWGEGGAQVAWGTVFIALALLGGFVAVPVGLLQDDPKVVLAYSSISQMGFLAVLVGVALASPDIAEACVLAAVVYAVHHGIAKGALFLGVQAWDVERLPRPVVVAVLVVAGMAVAGVPFTSGYVAKYGAKESVATTTFPVAGGLPLADVLPWVGLGSALLLVRFGVVMWRRERSQDRTPLLRAAVWAGLTVAAVLPVALLARSLGPPQSMPGWVDPQAWWSQSWPALLGVLLAVVVARIAARTGLVDSRIAHPRGDVVPPGDVVAVEERVVRAAGRGLGRVTEGAARAGGRVRAGLAATPSPLPLVAAIQARIGSWSGSGALLLTLVAVALV
ncbi:complex I subunit 5 family protein, partial [Nocardioides sp.]|uniref:complex I subunit 5 family protein n=1 Tax=Nocardioides sp. TaxID=35761 RepID=UPI0027352745